MERWNNKVAIVTGANSGIGKAIAIKLLESSMIVIGVARREDVLMKLNEEFLQLPGKFYYKSLDIRNETNIIKCVQWAMKTFGSIDVLINNVGYYDETGLTDESMEHAKMIMETNYLGGCIFTKEIINAMKSEGINNGHIININSVAGHFRTESTKALIHNAAKHCITLTTDNIRRMLVEEGSQIKITSLSPGVTLTEALKEHFPSLNMPCLKTDDVANAVLYILGTPPNVQVCELIIRAVGEFKY